MVHLNHLKFRLNLQGVFTWTYQDALLRNITSEKQAHKITILKSISMIIQFCGLSGSGKSTIAQRTAALLMQQGHRVEILDGDEYRKVLCADLGFSKEDRNTNIRRLAFVASRLSAHGVITIICAINPYEGIRNEVATTYPDVKTIFIDCDLQTLLNRDTKGLYHKALLPDTHPDKIRNLTGINDPFDIPHAPDLQLNTATETEEESVARLMHFLSQSITKAPQV